KPFAAAAISSGVKGRSTRPTDIRKWARRDKYRNSSKDGARRAVRICPASNGHLPTSFSLSCKERWKNATAANDAASSSLAAEFLSRCCAEKIVRTSSSRSERLAVCE